MMSCVRRGLGLRKQEGYNLYRCGRSRAGRPAGPPATTEPPRSEERVPAALVPGGAQVATGVRVLVSEFQKG